MPGFEENVRRFSVRVCGYIGIFLRLNQLTALSICAEVAEAGYIIRRSIAEPSVKLGRFF